METIKIADKCLKEIEHEMKGYYIRRNHFSNDWPEGDK
jgi:hypothetical protein